MENTGYLTAKVDDLKVIYPKIGRPAAAKPALRQGFATGDPMVCDRVPLVADRLHIVDTELTRFGQSNLTTTSMKWMAAYRSRPLPANIGKGDNNLIHYGGAAARPQETK
jgi:hypothetical protein